MRHLASFLIVVAGFAAAEASAIPFAKNIKLQPFRKLDVTGCFDVTLVQGSAPEATVRAPVVEHAKIKLEQQEDRVTIASDGDLCRGTRRIEIALIASFTKDDEVELALRGTGDFNVELPTVKALTLSLTGSGDLDLKHLNPMVPAKTCKIAVAGSGDLATEGLACDRAEIVVRGAGNAKLAGKTPSCLLEVRGSGDVDAESFACDAAKIDVAGSGNVTLSTLTELEVAIRGSGNVAYRGEPKLKGMDVKGSGKVRKL